MRNGTNLRDHSSCAHARHRDRQSKHREMDSELKIRVVSAENLKDVTHLGTMHSYVVAYLLRPHDPMCIKAMTSPDTLGGTSPVWNQTLVLPARSDIIAKPQNVFLVLQIYCSSSNRDDTLVGTVTVPWINAMTQVGSDGSPLVLCNWQISSAHVARPSGRAQGLLHFAVRLDVVGAAALRASILGAPTVTSADRHSASGNSDFFASAAPAPHVTSGISTAADFLACSARRSNLRRSSDSDFFGRAAVPSARARPSSKSDFYASAAPCTPSGACTKRTSSFVGEFRGIPGGGPSFSSSPAGAAEGSDLSNLLATEMVTGLAAGNLG